MPKKKRQKQQDPRLAKLLDRIGYTRLKAKHGHSRRPDFPDLTVGGNHRERFPSVGGFAPTAPRAEPPAGAKTFPVDISHKQGPMLMTAFDDPTFLGGKKT